MWQAYLKAVQIHAPNAQVLFDRFHLVQHLNRAVDEVRRSEMRRLSGQEKTSFKRTRFLFLKDPWNPRTDERERLSTLVRWNTPIVQRLLLERSLSALLELPSVDSGGRHLRRWMHSAMRSRLQPFKDLVRRLRAHLDGVPAWTRRRVSNGAARRDE
jgi:transposase